MLRRGLLALVFLVGFGVSVFAQEAGVLSFGLDPSLNVPLGSSASLYTMGAGAELKGTYILPPLPFTHVLASINYNLFPTLAQSSVSTLSLGIGGGVNYSFFQKLHLNATVQGGVFAASYNTKYALSGYLQADTGAVFSLFPSFSLGAEVGYKYYFGSAQQPLFSGLSASVSAVLHLGREHQPQLKIQGVQIDPVFPILRKYYDDKPLGKVVIRNGEPGPITDVQVSFYTKQFMDAPKQSVVIPEMKSGEEQTVTLNALFTDSILNTTENTIAQADVTVDYLYNKTKQTVKQSQSIRVLARQSLTWDDDRKAAAFVTANDPAVLSFSKHVAGVVRGKGAPALDSNLLMAQGLHEALSVFGMTYVSEPAQVFDARFNNKTTVDFMQFPTQTLAYRAGKCDDLSVLYNALLESVGVETAFITAPGHIFTAFALSVKPADLAATVTDPTNYIIMNDKVWVPVEITAINDSFVKAWDIAAAEWRKYIPTNQVGFFTTHDSWNLYEPVQFPGLAQQLKLPDEAAVVKLFEQDKQTFVDRQIRQRVADLSKLATRSASSARYWNRLGTLYARYGLYADAEKQYLVAIGFKYPPALVNMGNVQFLKNDFPKAMSYYQQALQLRPQFAAALLNAGVVSHFMGKSDDAKKYYQQAEAIDPALAADFQYLETDSAGGQ